MKILSHIFQIAKYRNGSALLFCCPVLEQSDTHIRVEHPFSGIALATVRERGVAFDTERDRWPVYIEEFSRWGVRSSVEDFRHVPHEAQLFLDLEEALDHIDRKHESVAQGARSELGAQFFVFNREVEPQNPKPIPSNAVGLEERVRESIRFSVTGMRIPAPEHRVARQKQHAIEQQEIRQMLREPA